MHRVERGTRTRRGVVPAVVGAALVAAMFSPGAAVASGSAPTVPDVHLTTLEDTPLDGNLLTGATDPEEDTLSIISFANFAPSFGNLTFTSATGDVTFTPAANASGSASTWFNVSDGSNVVQGHLYVSVTAVNDAPVCATPLTSSGNEDTQQSGTLACTDVDSANLSYARVAQASHGTAVVNADGSWTYTPAANYNGPDSFTFKANDGSLDSNTATMNLTVSAVNDAPVCASPVTSLGRVGAVQSGTLACTDVDSPDLTYTLVDQAAHGTAVVNDDGSWTYMPENGTFAGADSFTFKANDGSLDSNTATMDVTVSADVTPPVVGVPTLTLGSAAVNEAATIQISWSGSDAETGVASYQVQARVGTGAWTTIYTGAATSIIKTYHFSTALAWRVRATDGIGNTSGWATTTTHSLAAYQETSKSVTYTGTWTYRSASASSGSGYKLDTVYGKYAQLKFTGMQVAYVAPKMSTGGYVRVYVNGVFKGKFSLYRSSIAYGQVIYRGLWSGSGTRTIKIVNGQSGKRTTLDAFIVLR